MKIPAARVSFTEADRREIAAALAQMLSTGALTLGEHTHRFEEEFARRHHAPYAVAVSSGTSALEITLRALDVAGREVVVPTNTFVATAIAVQRAGAQAVFADVDDNAMALTPDSVRSVLTERTAAVVYVHIGGFVAPQVRDVAGHCHTLGIPLVEDAAHAHGATLDGTPAGRFGTAGTFSFYPTKVITSGEGGMLVTSDERIRDEALIYRDQGKQAFSGNRHVRPGYAWRMSEVHAATGEVHLRRLDEFLSRRREVAARYDEELASLPDLRLVDVPEGSLPNYYKYIAFLPAHVDRARLKHRLRERHDVALTGEVYDLPLHHQPVFAEAARGAFPVADAVCAQHVCLPVFSDMTDDEVDYVLESFSAIYRGLG